MLTRSTCGSISIGSVVATAVSDDLGASLRSQNERVRSRVLIELAEMIGSSVAACPAICFVLRHGHEFNRRYVRQDLPLSPYQRRSTPNGRLLGWCIFL